MIEIFDQRIREMAASGFSYLDMAIDLQTSRGNVYQYCARNEIAVAPAKRGRPPKPHKAKSREFDMKSRYEAGETLQQIGDRYGITRERVRQLLTKYFAFDRSSGGQAKTSAIFRAERRAKRDAHYVKKWGHDFAAHVALIKTCRALGIVGFSRERQPLGAFISQRRNANRRKIAWEFSFEDWWKFWQESGKWTARGRGKYGMCRFGDVGPYSRDNCYIATGSDNARHYQERRQGNLTEFSTARAA